jgi:methyltransferase (TIGR00027 family)
MKDDKPSATAILIAKSIVFVGADRRYRGVLPPETHELSRAFLRAATSDWQVQMWEVLGHLAPMRWLVGLIERMSVPGMIGHYIVRKRRLEDIALATAKRMEGLEQLVIIGAGLDTLGTRMARVRPELRVFELDHPATSAVKRSAFTNAYAAKPTNLSLVAVDLSKTALKPVLQSTAGFSFAQKTLFIAEGVFMYLTLADVGTTLSILHAFPERQGAFAFTYMLSSEVDGRPAFAGQSHGVDGWLGRKSEPFIWGSRPADLDLFIAKLGLKTIAHSDGQELRTAYLLEPAQRAISTAIGENIVWIEKSSA